jgi:hypothetical protein
MANQSLSDIHDSDNCHLGPDDLPCDMCVAAAEYERRKSTLTDADKAALLGAVIQRARDDLNDGQLLTEMRRDSGSSRLSPVEQRIAQAMERDKQFASLSVIRAAIADVLDTGDSENAGEWLFYSTEPDWRMDDRRERFTDAVCTRIVELQAPPHNMDAGLLAEFEKARKGGTGQ